MGLIIVLFFEKVDYILYSFIFIIVASIITAIYISDARDLSYYINTIEWDVIFFFIGTFSIVEILKENNFFDEIAFRIVKRFGSKPRKLFYIFCTITTLLASIIAGISIVVIFLPLIIIVCRKISVSPTPFLLGISICVNLAATLTPFGSAQNILISNELNIGFYWFLIHIMPYFLITFILTLISLDQFILKKYLKKSSKENNNRNPEISNHINLTKKITKRNFNKNCILLFFFILFLVIIPQTYLVAFIFAIIFVIFNPNKKFKNSQKKYSLIYYLQKIDYKLIYFFICLFIFIGLMEINGTLLLLEIFVENLSLENELLLSLIILLITSIFSGLIDNTPVSIIFIPVIQILIRDPNFYAFPLYIAFILGINLGGNFLPQGSPADLMILEFGRNNKIEDLTYKKMVKIGGLYAIFHILIGIGYLIFIILVI